MDRRTPAIDEPAITPLSLTDASAWNAEHLLKFWLAYQLETMRFAGRRSHANLEWLRCLFHCANWQEIGQLQQTWLKKLIADYGEEWGRMMGTGFELALTDVAPLQPLVCQAAPSVRDGRGETHLAA